MFTLFYIPVLLQKADFCMFVRHNQTSHHPQQSFALSLFGAEDTLSMLATTIALYLDGEMMKGTGAEVGATSSSSATTAVVTNYRPSKSNIEVFHKIKGR